MVGLTDDDPSTTAPVFMSSYTLCAQYSGSVGASESATVVCAPSSQKFRFVIVQGSLTSANALCLPEVSVYGSEHNVGRKLQLRCYCYSQLCVEWTRMTWKCRTRNRRKNSYALQSVASTAASSSPGSDILGSQQRWFSVVLTAAVAFARMRVTVLISSVIIPATLLVGRPAYKHE